MQRQIFGSNLQPIEYTEWGPDHQHKEQLQVTIQALVILTILPIAALPHKTVSRGSFKDSGRYRSR